MSDSNTGKQALLNHYAKREPFRFIQYDGFTEMWGDTAIGHDKDGETVCWLPTTELMSGCSAVRVLIREPEDPTTAVRLLRKIADQIERQGALWRNPRLSTLHLVGSEPSNA